MVDAQRRGVARLAQGASTLLCYLVLGISLAAMLGRLNWRLELLSHFRLQYAIAAVVTGLMGTWSRRRWPVLASAIGLIVNASHIVPLYFGGTPQAGPVLSVAAFNINSNNADPAGVVTTIRESDADLVFVLETTPRWRALLEQVGPPYRIAHSVLREDNFGMLLLSRVPLERVETVMLGSEIPAIEAEVALEGRTVTLLAVHPPPPVGPGPAQERDTILLNAARRAKSGATLLLGDFNTTPFAPIFDDVLEAGTLTNSQDGFGYQATWPQGVPPLWPAQIPLDHAVHTQDLITVDRSVGPASGSDHRIVRVTIAHAP